MMSNRKRGYSPLKAENNWGVTNNVMLAYVHEKINIQLFVLRICLFVFLFVCLFVLFCFVLFYFLFFFIIFFLFCFFLLLFYVFNLNTQGFVNIELHRNVQVFAKCDVCISAIYLFYIQTCPGFLPTSK